MIVLMTSSTAKRERRYAAIDAQVALVDERLAANRKKAAAA